MKLTNKMREELATYARMSGDEVGEVISLLLSLYEYSPYIDDGLVHNIGIQLIEFYKWFKRNTRIVKRERPKEYYYELEYLDG